MSVAEKQNSASLSLHPLFWLAVCFAIGILAGKYFETDWKITLALCLIFGILSLRFITRKLAVLFIGLAFMTAGVFSFQVKNQTVFSQRIKRIYDENRIKSGEPVEVEGVLQGKSEDAVGGFFIELESESLVYKAQEQDVSGKIRLFAPVPNVQILQEYEQLGLQNGARIRVACNLRREDDFQNPGVVSRKAI